ncbi:MAG: hypothetical protein E6H99_12710 [Chloroflexi bacterium]|nr:MAG: hypothetical protein E6I13_03125 [Chloroflexota bacterium]TMG18080.1 MAG: hypothetical protein E6H99_12710 [Chloroflexota bacterium]TMG67690.1 MAG: hypothetical protein E6H82_04580 [Chloroflexota bacterium]
MKILLLGVAGVILTLACSIPGASTASPAASGSPPGTPLAKASGSLGAQVPMPPDFPTDVPIYPGARLTAGAGFTSTGQEAWGMEWQTLDGVAKVQPFYAKQLNQGDWLVKFADSPPGSFKGTFARKSNSRVSGTLSAGTSSGVTKILMTLVMPR